MDMMQNGTYLNSPVFAAHWVWLECHFWWHGHFRELLQLQMHSRNGTGTPPSERVNSKTSIDKQLHVARLWVEGSMYFDYRDPFDINVDLVGTFPFSYEPYVASWTTMCG